ncbi:MAG: Ca-activated chloride channel family protein [Planctomycetota bacterium]|jgi:Ca-activated chloride channel family protein
MDLSFLNTSALGLLVLLPLLAFFPRPGGFARATLLRMLVGLLLILALAHPVSLKTQSSAHHVLLVDRSASVTQADAALASARASEWYAALPEGAFPSLIELGSDSGSSLLGDAPTTLTRIALGADASLAAAMIAAAAQVPNGALGSLTVLSDGLGADLQASRTAADLVRRGLPVHTQTLSNDPAPRPVGLVSLSPVRLGTSARLRATLAGQGANLSVAVFEGDVERVRVDGLQVDGTAEVMLSFEPERTGFLSLRLVLEGAGVDPARSSYSMTLPVDDPLRALYLGREGSGGAQAMGNLVGPGLRLETAQGDAQNLDAYDLVVLDDLGADGLPEELCSALAQAVTEDGLGLFACGARSAFGAGGWQDTALADVLPVEALQKEEKRDPSVALGIVIDTSGSMGGNRVQLAKEVARLAMRRLLPHDKVGIVEFYGAKRWAAPLQPASNSIELERALNRLAAGGGTVILPAIEEAFYGLLNIDARYKHILVLTDGGVESGAFEPMLRRMASRGITTSTVLIGGDAHSEFLVTLANWGKGRFYSVPNRFNLPEIMFKQPTSAKLSAWQPGAADVSAGGGPAWWGDMDPSLVPAVEGLVQTERKAGATGVLETVEGKRPVLASWRHGLGRVTAMPTEPVGPGSRGWDEWPDYGRFLARTLERTARDLAPFDFQLNRNGYAVTLTALRMVASDLLPAALVHGPDGENTELSFQERAPGRFEASWFMAPDALLTLDAGAAGQRHRQRLALDPAQEQLLDPRLGLDLASLSATSGGQALDFSAALPAPQAGGAGRNLDYRELRPWLLLLALAAYLFDVFDRRRDRATVESV